MQRESPLPPLVQIPAPVRSLAFKTPLDLASYHPSGPISHRVPDTGLPLLSRPSWFSRAHPPWLAALPGRCPARSPRSKRQALVKGHHCREDFRDSPDDQRESLLVLGSYLISLCLTSFN